MYTITVDLSILLLGLRGLKVTGRFDSSADAILPRAAGSSDRQSKQQHGHSSHDTHDKTLPRLMHACVRCLSSPALDHMLVATVVMVSGSAFGRSVAWSFLSGRLRSPQRRMPEPQRQAGPVMGRDPHTGISPHADSVCAAIGRAYAAARWFLDEDGQAFHHRQVRSSSHQPARD